MTPPLLPYRIDTTYRDKIDLGVDYGYGANAKACPEFIRVDTKNYVYDGFSVYIGEIYFRRTAPSVFEACRDGYHTVTYTTHNGLSGSVKVHVYSTKNATRMYLDKDVLREGYPHYHRHQALLENGHIRLH